MFNRVDAKSIDDLMLPISRRSGRGVFFARVCGWSDAVGNGVWAFHEAAQRKGVIIEGQLSNPDGRQMSYLNDVLGDAFEPNEAFLIRSLEKWTPRMSGAVRQEFARALCGQFEELRRRGKTESIQKNIYFKVMCWLYYRFERLMPMLGDDDPPRILYQTDGITAHELMMLRLLNVMGADVLLLEPLGDAPYLKQDPQSAFSQLLVPAGQPFPKDFSLKQLRKERAARPAPPPPPQRPAVPPQSRPGVYPRNPAVPPQRLTTPPQRTGAPPQRPIQSRPGAGPAMQARRPGAPIDPLSYFKAPTKAPCTNAWMKEADINQIVTPIVSRGDDAGLFYNAFIRVKGVVDKTTYVNELHQFYQRFKSTGRRICIQDGGLTMPTPEEIEKIRRREYDSPEKMTVDLAGNLPGCASAELQRLMQRAFVRTMQTAQKTETSLRRLLNAAVFLLCWIQRYQGKLFQGYKDGDVPCFVLMGGCANANEALYPLFLSQLPVDVLILAPDLNRLCALSADNLLELSGEDSLPLMKFPKNAGTLQMNTLASHAENELTNILYADSGIYRNQQFARGEALTLRTTYDELFILWDQELKYRSGFATVDQTVTMPVLYAKIAGVEDGKNLAYWQKIKLLLGKETYLVRQMPMLAPGLPNEFQSLALKSVRDGKLKRGVIRDHRKYPFGIIREELQAHIFDKLQLMLDQRLIKGTFENGTEYTVVATVLNMDKTLLRLLQSFDFTKKNPKLVCISTGDQGASLEDAILITFLNLVGFDIALFVPTGYQTIERFLRDNYPVEHQIGEYQYDLTVPDFDALPQPKGRSWLNNILKRGN